jgi:L-lactate utilization protein LutC
MIPETPALPSTPPPPPPPSLDEAVIRQVAPGAGVVERWIQQATRHEIRVRRCGSPAAEIRAAVDECLSSGTVGRCLLNAPRWEEPLKLAQHLGERGLEVVRWGDTNCAAAAFECDAALTDCRAGLADTGSLLVWSDAGFGRASTLVIPLHVVLLGASQIVPDLVDGLRLVQEAGEKGGALPSNIVLIQGPSKTADIEMTSITGVHGPREVWVVLVEDG